MTMEVRASAKFQRYSPRKARLVTDLITGKSAEEAIAMLENLPKGAALPIGRVVRSAIANAENNYNMTLENLYVKRAMADEGPRMKRIWMRGRGRRDTKLRRTSHITVIVDERKA
jgi:large subunit ribosomal protein L22